MRAASKFCLYADQFNKFIIAAMWRLSMKKQQRHHSLANKGQIGNYALKISNGENFILAQNNGRALIGCNEEISTLVRYAKQLHRGYICAVNTGNVISKPSLMRRFHIQTDAKSFKIIRIMIFVSNRISTPANSCLPGPRSLQTAYDACPIITSSITWLYGWDI